MDGEFNWILERECAMHTLWSPWRMKYIMEPKKDQGCLFCNALQQPDNLENLILLRRKLAFVMLNRYPYNNGHMMVVPVNHQASICDLTDEARAEMMHLLAEAERVLQEVYHPSGFNVGANIGSAAGAGVPGHVHFHILPRWAGDTNFMSTVGETRVLPEELDQTYQRLQATWRQLFPNS